VLALPLGDLTQRLIHLKVLVPGADPVVLIERAPRWVVELCFLCAVCKAANKLQGE